MVDLSFGEAGAGVPRHALPAVPSSVPTIRRELDRLLDTLEITAARAADIRLALTEACTNAVQHAYPSPHSHGTMLVTFEASPEALIVSVLDNGGGLDGSTRNPGLGLGLSVIEAVADAVAIEGRQPGTTVRMTFDR